MFNKSSDSVVAPPTINEYIGKTIRTMRQSRNLSLNDLAKELDLSYQQVQKYETGANRVGADTLYAIANILKTDANIFFPDFSLTEEGLSVEQAKLLARYDAICDEKLKETIFMLITRISSIVDG